MDWAQILVILLAIFFIVFLIVAIALAVLIIKVTLQIKAMATGAQRTFNALEGSVGAFSKSAVPLMVVKSIITLIGKRSKKKGV